jgi:hypothetical protein
MLMGGIKRPRTRVLGYRAEQWLSYVLRYVLDHGEMPTQQQICAGLGIASKGQVSRIEKEMRRRGITITRRPAKLHRETANPRRPNPVINGCP